jgi:hypothetical protein
MRHGAGGKWYLNAAHYSEEIVEKYNLREFLLEQYTNFEQISVRDDRAERDFGYCPIVPFDEAFRRTLAYLKSEG